MKLNWILVIAAIGVLCRFLWLGDASLLGDEASLLRLAWDSNQSGIWPDHGLLGSRGAVYGPMAIWIYKAFLHVSQDLTVLTLLKVLVDTSMLGLGMSLIYRSGVRFPGVWWLLPVLSPYFWFYSRQLWDNNFQIGFSIIAWGAALCFLREKNFGFLFLTVLALASSLNTHLMSASLVAGVALCLVWESWRFLIKNPLKAALCVLPIALLIPYFQFLRVNPPPPNETTLALSAVDGFTMGAKVLGSFLFGEYFLELHRTLPTWLAVPAMPSWVFSVLLIGCSWLGLKRFHGKNRSSYRTMVLFVFYSQVALSFYKDINYHPHYFAAVWPVFWFALGEGLPQTRWLRWLPVSLLVALLNFQILVHFNQGMNSGHYGPSISEWTRVYQQAPGRVCSDAFSGLRWRAAMGDVFLLLERIDPQASMKQECRGKLVLRGDRESSAALDWRL